MGIWYVLSAFDIFSPFWYIVSRKIWQPPLRIVFILSEKWPKHWTIFQRDRKIGLNGTYKWRRRLIRRKRARQIQGCQMVYFFIPKIEIRVYLWAHRNGIVGKFYGHFEYFMAIWRISFSFGIVCGYYICIFSPFWYGALRKIWQTWTNRCKNRETERRRWIQCCQANFPSIKQWRIGACSTREGLWGQCIICIVYKYYY
jgi:hypothetical protein